jgi:hypothetical protein
MHEQIEKKLVRYGADVDVRRVGLTLAQVRQYKPPPNFAKENDKNTPAYVARFGTRECWELDALSPAVMTRLVRVAMRNKRDMDAWVQAEAREQAARAQLRAVVDQWTAVTQYLEETTR